MAKRGTGKAHLRGRKARRQREAMAEPDNDDYDDDGHGDGDRVEEDGEGRGLKVDGWQRRRASERRTRVAIFVIVVCVCIFLYGFYVTNWRDRAPVTDDDDGGDGGNGNNSPNPLTAKTKVLPVKVLTFEEVTFDGSGSEPFQDITNYSWHIYKLWLNGPFMEDVTGRTATYRFNKTGTYYVYLSVKAKDGTVATSLDDSRYPGGKNENAGNIIEVLNRQPTMFAQASSADDPDLGPTVITGPDEPVTFDASGSFDQDGHMQRYEWDFGDDTTGTAEVVTHKYLAVGTYVAVCTGYDDDAGYSKGNVTVYVR